MKKKRIGFIAKLLILIVLLGAATCFVDYTRVLDNEEPLFAIKQYDSISKIQKYRGLFYIVERKISVTPTETMAESKNISFKVLIYELSLKARKISDKKLINMKYKEEEQCTTSKLIYATETIKIYTYCLDNIEFTENSKKITYDKLFKNTRLIEVIPFSGLDNDKTTEIYIDENKEYSKNGIKIFKCNNNHDRKSIYITTMSKEKQNDFCTYKDDDFKFVYKLEDTSEKDICKVEKDKEPLPPEIFYEDEKNQYSFDCQKSQNIKLISYNKEITLKDALNNKIVTIDELKQKGLVFNTISKETKTE